MRIWCCSIKLNSNLRYRRGRLLASVISILVMIFTSSSIYANDPTALTGIVEQVRDGDTILVGPVPIRLQGVSAPERNDPLGFEATAFMTDLVLGKSVRCELDGNKTYDRFFGICFLGEKDVGALIILSGFALDCPRFSQGRYKNLEQRQATQSIKLPAYCR